MFPTKKLLLASKATPMGPIPEKQSIGKLLAKVVTAYPGAAIPKLKLARPAQNPEGLAKFTVALPGTGRLRSVTSIAVYVTASALLETAVNCAFPVASVVALPAEITEPPSPCDRFTNLPEDGLPFASCNVTVMVVVSLPFALTLVGLALMPPAAAGGVTKSTFGCFCKTTLSVVSVTVRVIVSGTVSLTEKTTAPFARL